MAIYHLEAKVVSRGNGRSAVAASAYLSCSKILNDYDGVQHDFTRKKGLIWQDVFLPEFAPSDWKDRSVLWNAVEKNEKTKDSRLAREFVPALPIELTPSQWQELLTDFIQNNFVADGMCADVAVHDPYPPGHNPHAHIMVTGFALWTKKETGSTRPRKNMSVSETAKNGALPPLNSKRRRLMGGRSSTLTRSAARRYICRPPKQKNTDMNGSANTQKARNTEGKILSPSVGTAKNNLSSGARRGQMQRIVIWNGTDMKNALTTAAMQNGDWTSSQPFMRAFSPSLERQGVISDRCEINRQIKADNALLHELKAAVRKLAQAVKNTIPALAEAMERLRGNMIIFRYQLRHIGMGKHRMNEHIQAAIPKLERYMGLVRQFKEKTKERKNLLAEKKETPFYQIPKLRDLARSIAELTEELEELKTEKEMLLRSLDCADDTGISSIKKDIAAMESALKKLEAQEAKYSAELDAALKEYSELKKQASEFDAGELMEARLSIRGEKERSAVTRVQDTYGEKYDSLMMFDSKRDAANLLHEEAETRSVRERLRQKQQTKTQRQRKPKHYEQER